MVVANAGKDTDKDNDNDKYKDKMPGVVNEQNGGRGNAHTLESSLCTTMVEIWQRRISKGKLREILGSIFGNCAFSPQQLERQQATRELLIRT